MSLRTDDMHRGKGAIAALILTCVAAALPTPLAAHPATPAGTRIANTARLVADRVAIDSNTVTLAVDEVLDVAIVAQAGAIDIADAAIVAVGFDVTQLGNAAGTVMVAGTADDAAATVAGIAADTDGDGIYDAGKDMTLTGGAIALAAGERRRIFVLVSPGAASARRIAVTATATVQKGSGAAGTVIAAAGPAGVDAIVGTTGAQAAATTLLVRASARPRLDKSQSVVAPDGSARVMRGSIVTYRLDAHFPDTAIAAEVADAIPAGTAFVPGSITLDDRPVSDAADGDTARFDGAVVRVALGDITTPTTRVIRFQAMIQ